MSRESVAIALFNQLKSAAGFVTTSRRLRHWSDVAPVEMPAFFLAQGDEAQDPNFSRMGGVPLRRTTFKAYIYVHAGGTPDSVAASALNPLLDALEAALKPLPGQKQTLGDTVVHAFINGAIETDEGNLGDQAVAIIPIEVLTTP